MNHRKVEETITARDPKVGMSVSEIKAALADTDDNTKVKVRIGFKGQIQAIMIKTELP